MNMAWKVSAPRDRNVQILFEAVDLASVAVGGSVRCPSIPWGIGSGSVSSLAIIIMPAHVPHRRIPSLARFAIGALSWYKSIRRLKVVSLASGHYEAVQLLEGRREAAPPQRPWLKPLMAATCSAKSPCTARTPTLTFFLGASYGSGGTSRPYRFPPRSKKVFPPSAYGRRLPTIGSPRSWETSAMICGVVVMSDRLHYGPGPLLRVAGLEYP